MKLFPVVRRIIQSAGGTPAWRPLAAVGLSLAQAPLRTLSNIAPAFVVSIASRLLGSVSSALSVVTRVEGTTRPVDNTAVGVSTTQAPARLLGSVTAACSVSAAPSRLLGAVNSAFSVVSRVEGIIKPAVNTAMLMSSLLRLAQTQTPAMAMERVEFNLTHNRGGVTATTTGTWTTATNAQGDVNTTLATAAGEALGVTKTITLDYADLVGKGSLTITAVRLVFYSRITNVLVNDTTVRFERSLDNGGAYTTLQTVTADYDELVSGRSFTLSPVPTLAQIQGMRARITVVFPAVATLKVLSVDAIHLQVDATETWLI